MFETAKTAYPPYTEYPEPAPHLARLEQIEEELTRSANLIESFIDRCRGGCSGTTVGALQSAPKMTGHFATIERIGEQMVRIDKAARELGNIG